MRYIIGIDLGTTNSAVAYIDKEKNASSIQIFSIPQLVSSGRVEPLPTLPSFCYLVSKEEWPKDALRLPWKEENFTFVGQFAKSHGSRVPTRLIQSAKSWLCNVAANRKDRILPIEASDISHRLSPVEASAKYLTHIKDAWNASIAQGNPAAEFEEQEIILTVPASFDEVARTLTVEAARLAGIVHLTLLEEPQAAFYSWISQHESIKLKDPHSKKHSSNTPRAGETILVCDVGGGTTDFSLIEVQEKDNKLSFQRMAVGDHLLLGGDNMDAALAHILEKQLRDRGFPALESTQWHQLYAEARAAKESLLQPKSPDQYTVVLQGVGSSVIKGSITIAIHKEEMERILLDGFFGQYSLQEALQMHQSRGFRTVGLPYEDEPSITKHLARFLKQARCLDKGVDYILFNGGALKPTLFQQAVHQSLIRWFPHKCPAILESVSLDLAVARGSAYYGKARKGLGVFIGGGLPRTYYLQIDVKESESGNIVSKALTLLSRGAEEGAFFEPEQVFMVSPNTPSAFHLLTSHVRLEDRQGTFVAIDEQEMQRLPSIHTILRYGRKQLHEDQEKVPVKLDIRLTAVGTLELWLQSQKSEHKWNLEFQVRSESGLDSHLVAGLRQDETFEKDYLDEAQKTLENLYKVENVQFKPGNIIEKLEEVLHKERRDWPSSILRGLWDSLLKSSPYRKISLEHEVRWWNLAGFFLRPGYGYPLDDFRIKEFWKILLNDLKQSKTAECQIQHWICYRRIAGGLNKGQQMQIASEIIPTLLDKKSNKIEVKSRSELYAYSEKIRALASFERLEVPLKIRLGEAIVNRIIRKEAQACDYWALGRIGARHLLYGSIGQVVPKDTCSKWVEKLLETKGLDVEQLQFVFGQLARKTDYRELNLAEAVIEKILERDVDGKLKELLFRQQALTQVQQEQVFGDRLPSGLMLEV